MTVFAPLQIGDVSIEEIEHTALTDDDISALNAFQNAMRAEAHPDDPPETLRATRAEYTMIPEFIGARTFVGREPDSSVVAVAYAWWRTEDNLHMTWVVNQVRPDRRRRGLGMAMLSLLVEVAEAEGRTVMMGNTSDRVPAGEAFAARVGAEAASAVHTNRLVLADLDRELVAKWISNGPHRAPGYSLVSVDGRYPDDLVERIARVHSVMNTAPRDDLELEDQVFTVEHLREWEKTRDASGTIRWSIFARHDATSEFVGLTEVYWNPDEPDTMWQGDTGVDPGHRGNALGKWLKAAMLDRILHDRAGCVDVRTGNADSNEAMLGINVALGFRPYVAQTNWQVPVERLRGYVDGSSS